MAATQDAKTVDFGRPKRLLASSRYQTPQSKTEYELEQGAPLGRTTEPWRERTEDRRRALETTPLSIETGSAVAAEVANEEASLVSEGGKKTVDAVVSEITDSSVILTCSTSTGNILVSFPLSIIPLGLRGFGQPVRLSTDRSSGYRVPRIEARIPNEVPALEGEDDIAEWIGTL
jgi:hypothetical protein